MLGGLGSYAEAVVKESRGGFGYDIYSLFQL